MDSVQPHQFLVHLKYHLSNDEEHSRIGIWRNVTIKERLIERIEEITTGAK